MKIEYPEGATPLDEDYRQDLIPDIQLQAELNEFEQMNIVQAIRWASRNERFLKTLLTPGGICELHGRMFNAVWRWAGKFRIRNTNIGVEWHQVPENVALVCGDAEYWIANQVFGWNELAVRLHHRLVQVHPFPNGNGRHARLVADLLLEYPGQPKLPWGRTPLGRMGNARTRYIAALRQADEGSYGALVDFARSTGV